jgi:hypothetical protein
MADLRITELAALASADLAANDLLPVADISASETKKITVTDFTGKAVTLIADATIPGAKILFGSNEIPGTALENGAVDTTQLADNGVTAAKLADESSVDLVTTLPASGAFVGQIALDTDDSKIYCWDGTNWVSIKAAGSVNTVIGDTAGIVNLAIATAGDQITITTSLDNTSAAAQFLAGPTSAAGTVAYRTIAAGDLPTATSTDKGAVVVNGNGLALSGNTIIIDNTVTEETSNYHIVRYDSKGLVTEGRTIVAADVPIATSSSIGVVRPGSGLGVDGVGLISHTNSVVAGTATKVTFDAEGHITGTQLLEAADIPDIDATKLTTGTLESARIGTSSISGAQIANYAVSKIGETQPTADHIGQFFFNPLSRDLFLWDGNVYQPIGISVGEIVFAGTFDASAGGGTGLVASVTAEGTAVGLVVGQALPAAAIVNNRYYLVVSEAGTITSGNAPQVSLSPPDIILSNGSSWTEIDVSQTVTAQIATNVSFSPTGDVAATNVQAAIEELDSEKLPKAGGTVTGALLIGSGGSLEFEGTSDNTFETTLAVVDPTADRTITLPNATGTVVLSGAIVDADINASAAIAGTKIEQGTTSARGTVQLTDSTSSTSATTAATPNSVKSAYDLANAALPKSGGVMTGDITLNAQSDLRWADSDSSNWVAFQAPATVSTNVTWTLPAADGTNGQVLTTNGTGTLSWATTSAPVTSVGGQTGAVTYATTWAVGTGASAATNTDLDLAGTYAQTVVAVSALNIDCSTGNYFTKTINGASTFTVSNVPTSRAYAFTLELTHTSGTITWFSGVEWPSGTAPTLTTGKTHLFMFVTDDGGTRWRASSLINYTN